jgi:serine/threonine-protein kinase
VLGRWDEAAAQIEVARQLDPLSAIILEGRAHLCLFRREYEQALRELQALLDLDPLFYKAYTAMGRIYAIQGRCREALEMFNQGRAYGGDVPSILAATGQVQALLGEREQALRCIETLEQLSREKYIPMACFAIVHLGLGNVDTVLNYLERAADQRESSVVFLKVHPLYDPLRGEPRFQGLLKRAGFLP